jgi:anti-sigma-K factor RskA
MTHAEIKEDLSLFALGTLDPSESREVEVHLKTGCDECQGELRSWREVVGLLGLANEEESAPDLKTNLLGRIETKPPPPVQRRRVPWQVVLPLAAALIFALGGIVRSAQLRSYIDKQRRRADALAVERDYSRQVAGGLRQEVTDGQRKIDELAAQLATKEKDLGELRAALAKAEESAALLQAPGLKFVRLRQTPNNRPSEAHALLNTQGGRAIFYAFDLPPVAGDKTYELWWITEKKGPINAGLFVPDERGLSRVEGEVPRDAGAIQAAAVTVEPAEGVPKPSGPMVLHGKLLAG